MPTTEASGAGAGRGREWRANPGAECYSPQPLMHHLCHVAQFARTRNATVDLSRPECMARE